MGNAHLLTPFMINWPCIIKTKKNYYKEARNAGEKQQNNLMMSLLDKFLKNFTPCFTKKQMAMFTLVVYAYIFHISLPGVRELW